MCNRKTARWSRRAEAFGADSNFGGITISYGVFKLEITRPSMNQLASASVNRGRLAQARAREACFYKPELLRERRMEAKAQPQNDRKVAGPAEGWRGGMNRAGGLVGVRRIKLRCS